MPPSAGQCHGREILEPQPVLKYLHRKEDPARLPILRTSLSEMTTGGVGTAEEGLLPTLHSIAGLLYLMVSPFSQSPVAVEAKAGLEGTHRALTRGDDSHDGRDAVVSECSILKTQPFLANLHLHFSLRGEGNPAQTYITHSSPLTHPGLQGLPPPQTRRGASPLAEMAQSKAAWRDRPPPAPLCLPLPRNLQDEDKVVDRAVALVEVMLRCLLVFSIILELLDDVGVLQEPQQNLL